MANLTEVRALDVAGFLFIHIHIPSGSPWDAVVLDITQKWNRNVVSPLLLKNNKIFFLIYGLSEQQRRKGRDSISSVHSDQYSQHREKGKTFFKI